MKKKILTYLFLPILILFLAFLFGFSKHKNQQKKVSDVVVEFAEGDNYFLSHNMVDNLLIQNGKAVKEVLISSVDLYSLERVVLSNPYVEKASVFMSPEGLITTKIKQREPVIRVVLQNERFYVDKFAKKVPLSTNFSARVPLVAGVRSTKEIKQVLRLIDFISKDDFLKKEIVAIEKKRQDYLLRVRSGSYIINFGMITDVDVKFKKMKAFYNKAVKHKTLDKYETINLKFHNQVVCTKHNQDGKQ